MVISRFLPKPKPPAGMTFFSRDQRITLTTLQAHPSPSVLAVPRAADPCVAEEAVLVAVLVAVDLAAPGEAAEDLHPGVVPEVDLADAAPPEEEAEVVAVSKHLWLGLSFMAHGTAFAVWEWFFLRSKYPGDDGLAGVLGSARRHGIDCSKKKSMDIVLHSGVECERDR